MCFQTVYKFTSGVNLTERWNLDWNLLGHSVVILEPKKGRPLRQKLTYSQGQRSCSNFQGISKETKIHWPPTTSNEFHCLFA